MGYSLQHGLVSRKRPRNWESSIKSIRTPRNNFLEITTMSTWQIWISRFETRHLIVGPVFSRIGAQRSTGSTSPGSKFNMYLWASTFRTRRTSGAGTCYLSVNLPWDGEAQTGSWLQRRSYISQHCMLSSGTRCFGFLRHGGTLGEAHSGRTVKSHWYWYGFARYVHGIWSAPERCATGSCWLPR